MLDLELAPVDLGLPEKFSEFRQLQNEAIQQIVYDPKRFQGVCVPTGGGKSLISAGVAKLSGWRTVILTSTKGLQEQYNGDFGDSGLVDIRGKTNYDCTDVLGANCRTGEHEGCRRNKRCEYQVARRQAVESDLIVTNYAYWIRANRQAKLERPPSEEKPNPVQLLICDEGHKTMEELSKNLQVVLREKTLIDLKIRHPRTDNISEWAGWSRENQFSIETDLLATKVELGKSKLAGQKIKLRTRLYHLQELLESVESISSMSKEYWLCEESVGTKWGRLWTFDNIWPGNAAERYLFLGIPKVVIMSATLRPLSLKMLGLKPDQYTFREWPRIFPAQNSPNYHVRTARLNAKTEAEPETLRKWLNQIDAIIESRLDRKGIIHSVSYKRQQYLLANSRFSSHFVCNGAGVDDDTASETVERFKQSKAPSILVSPSMSTGWDFPGDQCYWQIITKLPYPDTRSKIMKARLERSEKYANYLVMQDIVQACGRGTRTPTDRCEQFFVDSSIEWFMPMNKALAPDWFRIVDVNTIPPPIKL